MQKYDNLGQVFKNLRTNRRISLKQISNDAVSVSQLSRFERGASDLSIGKFLIALENMNVEVSEFIDAVHNNQQTEQIRFMSVVSRVALHGEYFIPPGIYFRNFGKETMSSHIHTVSFIIYGF